MSKEILSVKTCSKCGKEKELEQFYRASKAKDGRMTKCIACHTKYDRERGQTLHRKASLALKDARRARRIAEQERGEAIEDNLTLEQVKVTLQQAECSYCGEKVPERQRTIDHVQSMRYSGDNSFSNVTMACRSCNSVKNDTPIILHYMREEITDQEAAELVFEVAIKERITFKAAFQKLAEDVKRYFNDKTEKAIEKAEQATQQGAEIA